MEHKGGRGGWACRVDNTTQRQKERKKNQKIQLRCFLFQNNPEVQGRAIDGRR